MRISEEIRQAVDRRFGAIQSERTQYEPDFRDLEQNFSPRRARWYVTQNNAKPGANKNIVNGTPLWAVQVLKSGMMSGHTSPSRPWFKLVTPDPAMMEASGVRDWLYLVETRMREVFARSNIYNALPTCYGDLAVWGTTALGIFPDIRDTIRAYPYLLGSYWIANGPRLSVDTFGRRWRSTVGNVVDEFGIENVQTSVRKDYEQKNFDKPIDVCHLIQPNRQRDPRRADNRNMPYQSVYWQSGWPEQMALRVSGYNEMPVMVARWEVAGEAAWGDGAAINALGDAKQLQFEEKRYAQLLDKLAEPSYNVPTQLGSKARSTPGAYNFVDPVSGVAGMTPVYVPNPAALQFVTAKIQDLQQRIRQILLTDVFLMLSESDRRQVTAREVEEKHSEKLMLLGPMLERLSDELLDPMISRVFAIMLRDGMVPEWPEALDAKPIKIEYTSILAQAQKAVAAHAIEAVGGYVAGFAKVSPDAMDKFDIDQAIDEYADIKGAPPTIIRSDEAVANIRRQRQQAQAAAQAAATAQAMAGAAKDLGNTPMGQGSALDALVGG